MSDGVIIEGKRIIYGQARSLLPVIFPDGDVVWVMWGERREADFYPHGGWVHPSDLKGRAWRPWKPKEVVIAADGFMVHKPGGSEEWFPLGEDEGISAILACSEDDSRVYIVATQPPEEHSWARRWPEIVKLVYGRKRTSQPIGQSRENVAHAKLGTGE
jgi:hypothetical protein